LNAAIRADQLTFTPGLATLQAPDLQTSLQQLLPTIFDATGASTIATLLKELAAAPPATPRVPLSKVEAEEVVLVAAVRVALLPALPALALPALPPLAIVAGGGWQWFPPGFYVELTPAGSNAVIAAATAGAAALTPLLVPVLGVGAAGAAVIAAALALQVGAMKVAQAASVKGAIKIKITPQVPPLPPLIYPWPA